MSPRLALLLASILCRPRGGGLALLLAMLVAPASGAQLGPMTPLSPADPQARQDFGYAVALDGPVAVVGALRDDGPVFVGSDYGAAYVLHWDGAAWTEAVKLAAPEPSPLEQFGLSVAVGGGHVLVGVPGDDDVDTRAGAAYAYRYDGAAWVDAGKLLAPDGVRYDLFGTAVAVDGNVALVGAPDHALSGFGEGVVYVYRFDGVRWAYAQTLAASDAADAASFGYAVALDGGRAVVGSPGARAVSIGQSAGAAYVFEESGGVWTETAVLAAADTSALGQFGFSVAIDGDGVLVGAPLMPQTGRRATGVATVFRESGGAWSLEQELIGADSTGFSSYGWSVALEGDTALVGAPNGGRGTGRAYLHAYDEAAEVWGDGTIVVPGGTVGGDDLGASLAIDDGVLLVGAPGHDAPDTDTGRAYVYGTPTGVVSVATEAGPPAAASLSAPHPNPARTRTRLALSVPEAGDVTVSVYDALGRRVAVLYDGRAASGVPLDLVWDVANVAPGVYVVRAGGASQTVVVNR